MINLTRPDYHIGGYQEFRPPRGMAGLVHRLWRHSTPAGIAIEPDASHRVVTYPYVSMCFTCFRDSAGEVRNPVLSLIGLVSISRQYAILPGYEMVAIALKPERTLSLLGASPAEHFDAIDDLLQIDRARWEPLLDRLVETRSSGAALRILYHHISTRTGPQRGTPDSRQNITGHALEIIRRSAGRIGTARLAQHLGLSARHLQRLVRDATGMTPKILCRQHRFLKAVTIADNCATPDWSDLASATGFYDQAHLIRDYLDLAETSPAKLFRERRAESEIYNIAVA